MMLQRLLLVQVLRAACLGIFIILVACSDESTTDSSKILSELAADAFLVELAAKYGATIDWDSDFAFSLQAQERLVTGRPVLFKGLVDDVFERDGKTLIRFEPDLASFHSPYLILELECSRSMVETIFRRVSDDPINQFFDEYAVVADIQRVSKAVVAVGASAFSADGNDIIEMYLDRSDLFTASGTCIDIVYIGAD